MLSSLVCSAFIIYLYRKLSAEAQPAAENAPADSLDAELEALNAQIASLESKIGK